MALPSDAMASVQFNSMTNVRASTDYGINDDRDVTPVQPAGIFPDSNFNIGGSSLLAFALDLAPSKDIFWTHRPQNCDGNHTAQPQVCGRWGAHTNPGSNCELNAIVATLSTGPVSIADKAGDTNVTLVSRCVRSDGRILQPDKPATAVDSMFVHNGSNPERTAPSGQVWTTFTAFENRVWHYVLSIGLQARWRIRGDDFYPSLTTAQGEGWVAHTWFRQHSPTPCRHGHRALESGCVLASVHSAQDIPALQNVRPIMVFNDTHKFDLMELAPIVNGWVLLGEVDRYVRVSHDRFDAIEWSSSGIRVNISGTIGESLSITALEPASDDGEWLIHVENITLKSSEASIIFETS
jgi:hypothetical protein